MAERMIYPAARCHAAIVGLMLVSPLLVLLPRIGFARSCSDPGATTPVTGYPGISVALKSCTLSAGETIDGFGGLGIAHTANATITQTGGQMGHGGGLYIGLAPGVTGTYNLSGGEISGIQSFQVGANGVGVFNHTAGDNLEFTTLGANAGSTGTYNQSGGFLAGVEVGRDGTGIFNYSGGTLGGINIGGGEHGLGEFNLNAGTLESSVIVGIHGQGTFTNNATHRLGDVTLGWRRYGDAVSKGTYILDGQELSSGDVTVGREGIGVFEQRRGDHNVSFDLVVGQRDRSHGTYNQTRGFTAVTGVLVLGEQAGSQGFYNLEGKPSVSGLTTLHTTVGKAGRGVFTQRGGGHDVVGTLSVGAEAGGDGFYALKGGWLDAYQAIVGDAGLGSVTHSAGSATLDYGLRIGNQAGITGRYELLDGGSLTTGGNEVVGYRGAGEFVQRNTALHSVGNDLVLADQATGDGSYTLEQGRLEVGDDLEVGKRGHGDFIQQGGSEVVVQDNLYVGKYSNRDNTYTMWDGTLSVGSCGSNCRFGRDSLVIGLNGKGTFTQIGARTEVTVASELALGGQGGNGVYELMDGSLATGDDQKIGDWFGDGTVIQGGGSNTVGMDLIVGHNGDGEYRLSGTGSIVVKDDLVLGAQRGREGTFRQSGGTQEIADTMYVGDDAGSKGTYYLSAGSLKSADAQLGNDGTGIFNQTGGRYTVGDLDIGDESAGRGTYNLLDGTLEVTDDTTLGGYGTGTFSQDGGLHDIFDTLYVGDAQDADGAYGLSAGTLKAGYMQVGNFGTGAIKQTGGISRVLETLVIGDEDGGAGSYILEDGELSARNETVGRLGKGTLKQTGGMHTVAADLAIGGDPLGPNLTGNAAVTQEGGIAIVGGNLVVGAGDMIGDAEYLLDGGSLSVGGGLYVGEQERGVLKLSGGTLSVGGGLYVGEQEGGVLKLSGGTLTAGRMVVGGDNPDYAATVEHSAGSAHVMGQLDVGEAGNLYERAEATYALSGNGGLVVDFDETIAGHGLAAGVFTQGGSSTHTVKGNLFLGGVLPLVSGSYEMNGGTLTVEKDVYIGSLGAGSFTQSGGETAVQGNLHVRSTADEDGKRLVSLYQLSGNGTLAIGKDLGLDGVFRMHGGTHAVDNGTLYVGGEAGDIGAYEIHDGDGVLSAFREVVGGGGEGRLSQQGGRNIATDIIVGATGTEGGAYFFAKGLVEARTLVVGDAGTGKFTHVSGPSDPSVNRVRFDVVIGNQVGGEGSYRLAGVHASLTAQDLVVGKAGKGEFHQADGVNRVKGSLKVGDQHSSTGTYQIDGGRTQAAKIVVGGQAGIAHFKQTGGVVQGLDANNEWLQIDIAGTGDTSYELEGDGNLSAFKLTVGSADNKNGRFFHKGGGTSNVGQLDIDGENGYYRLGQRGSLTVLSETLNNGAHFFQEGGTHTVSSLEIQASRYELIDGMVDDEIAVIRDGGHFKQFGGTLGSRVLELTSARPLSTDGQSGGAVYELHSGNLNVDGVTKIVGSASYDPILLLGDAIFEQTGGKHSITGDGLSIVVEDDTAARATYALSAGELVISKDVQIYGGNNDGIARFEQRGGKAKILGTLKIENNSAVYALTGGELIAGAITNEGTFDYAITHADRHDGAYLNLGGNGSGWLTNYGRFNVNQPESGFVGSPVTVYGNFVNDAGGVVKTTDTKVRFTGTFHNDGIYDSDPSDNYFNDLTIGETGYLLGGAGDNFFINGNFMNGSRQFDLWDTTEALLGFTGDGANHQFGVGGVDYGFDVTGFADNFSWGSMELARGGSLDLLGTGGYNAIYLDTLLLSADSMLNLNGINIYYRHLVNQGGVVLGGELLDFNHGSSPAPEPATGLLFAAGLAGMAYRRRARRGDRG